MDLVISLPPPPRPAPSEEVTCIQLGVSIDPTPYEGQTAPPWWWFVIVVFVVYSTFRTIPTVVYYGVLRGFSTITGLSC